MIVETFDVDVGEASHALRRGRELNSCRVMTQQIGFAAPKRHSEWNYRETGSLFAKMFNSIIIKQD